MKASQLIAVVAALLVGAFLMYMLRPAPETAAPSELVDGKYLVVEGTDGHWIYEKGDKGLTVRVKEMAPQGLGAIWGLQGKFLPYAVEVGGVSLVNVPATAYSTETGAFQVIHRFYKYEGDKLVEVSMEALKAPTK